MATDSFAIRAWRKIKRQASKDPGLSALARKMELGYREEAPLGSAVYQVEEGEPYEAAAEMLLARARVRKIERQLERERAHERLLRQRFWLTVEEETGMEAEGLYFHPATFTLRKHKTRYGETPDSLRASIERYAALIRQALTDPVSACQMAVDAALPTWMRQLAWNLGASQDLRPGLRRALERCLEDPKVARRWAEADEGNMPPWFVSAAGMLGTRRKWPLP